MARLFAYGSLRHPKIQELLFGRILETKSANFRNHWVYAWGEYYVLRPEPGGRVDGLILELTDKDLAIADLWEEVPLYRRQQIDVCLADGPDGCVNRVWCYFLNTSIKTGFVRVERPGYSALPTEQLIEEAKIFIEEQATKRG